MLNDVQFYPSYEIIGGEKIMAPSATAYHGSIILETATLIKNYFRKNKNGYVFVDDIDVHFPDGSIYKPDLIVITSENSKIINWNGVIKGVPDMVVEVLSKSTMKNDMTIKKNTYEKFGVKEYWIVDAWKQSISVYILRDGKFEFDEEYIYYNADEWGMLNDEQRANAKFEITLSFFPDLKINIKDIFELY